MKRIASLLFLGLTLIHATGYAEKACLLAELNTKGNLDPVADLGDIDPEDKNSIGSVALNATVTAGCIGMGTKNPGILCAFLDTVGAQELRRALTELRDRRHYRDGNVYATAYSTGAFGEMALRWLDTGSNRTHVLGCLDAP